MILHFSTFNAFMASSSVRSSPAKMILILSLQATPNADLKMWIAALPCNYDGDDGGGDDDGDDDTAGDSHNMMRMMRMILTDFIPLD